MKIAVNATILDDRPSGLGVYTINIIRGLCRNIENGVKLVIFTACPEYFIGFGAEIRNVSGFVQPKYGRLAGIFRFIWTQFVYPVRLMKEDCDVIYNTTHHAVFFTARPQIMTIYDLLPIKFPSRYRLQHYYFKFVIPVLLKKCASVITVSENSKKDIAEYYGICPEKIGVVYSSYDAEIFKPAPSIDREHPSAGGQYVLAIGASYLNKNMERLLEAYSRIKDRISCKLVIAGGRGQYIKILKAKADDLKLCDRVSFLDYVENKKLSQLYSNAAMLVFPSVYEGFGIPPLEAMACGCPVIVSSIPPLLEVCGDAAYYIDPYDTNSMAEGILSVLRNDGLRKTLVEKGLSRVKLFSWQKSAQDILTVIKKACYENRNNP